MVKGLLNLLCGSFWLSVLAGMLTAVSPPAIHHILMDGQSLSQGVHGMYGPGWTIQGPLSTTQPFSNLMLGNGCNWNGSICAYTGVGFSPLIEATNPTTGSTSCTSPSTCEIDETLASGMANTLTSLTPGGFVSLVSHHGISAQPYSVLRRIPSSPMLPITGSPSYQTIVDAITTAKANALSASRPYTADALVITHGETDFGNHMPAATYEAALLQWQADVSFDRNRITGQTGTIPMFIDQMDTWSSMLYYGSPTTDGTPNPASAGTPLAQWWAARDHPGSVFLTTPKYGFLAYMDDQIHLINTGYRLLGGYHAKALKKVLVDGGRWVPLAPRSISITGNVITLRLWVPVGSLAIDTTSLVEFTSCANVVEPQSFTDPTTCRANGGTWKVKGLEFYDSTMSAYVTTVTVASSDTLTITLNTAPTGTDQRLRSAYSTRVTNVAPLSYAMAPGTNIRDTDTTVDYSGSHLYDWLVTFDEPMGFTWNPYAGTSPPGRALPAGPRRGNPPGA